LATHSVPAPQVEGGRIGALGHVGRRRLAGGGVDDERAGRRAAVADAVDAAAGAALEREAVAFADAEVPPAAAPGRDRQKCDERPDER
jgi:hypothetical protein